MPRDTAGFDDESRNHPLITKTDWGFLTTDGYFDDHKNPSSSRIQQRKKLRKRIRNGLLDLSLLLDNLSEEDREELADELKLRPMARALSGGPVPAPPPIPNVIAFLFLLHTDTDHFERTVVEAVKTASRASTDWKSAPERHATHREIEVDIAVEERHIDGEAVREKVTGGETDDLTDAERQWLIELLAKTGELPDATDEAHRKAGLGGEQQAAQRVVNRLEDEAEENTDGSD